MKKNILALAMVLVSLQGCSSLPQAALAVTPLGGEMRKMQIDNALRQGEAYSKAMRRQQALGKIITPVAVVPPQAAAPQSQTAKKVTGVVIDTILNRLPYLIR